jgi:uncharacterized OB-fold protein
MAATTKVEGKDVWIYEGQIHIPNTYTAGALGTKVFTKLKDEKKIMGMRCPSCNKVFALARSTCRDCFEQMEEMVELGDQGTILTYTVCLQPNPIQPKDTPITYAVIQLDGADNGMVHMLGEVAPEAINIGMRVQARFKEERTGNLLDIEYFKPV